MSKILVLFLLLSLPLVGFAYSDPTGPPPTNNSAPPLNIGSQTQSKAGDLGVGNFIADGGVTLGGVFSDSWLDAGSACAWEGTRCSCASDDSSVGFVTVTLGVTCVGGTVTDFGLKGFNFSSREGACSAVAPVGCEGGYSVKGPTGVGGSAVMRTLESGVAVFNNYVVRTIRGIGKLFRKWF